MDVVLIEQKKSNLLLYGNPAYVFKYDLRRLYTLKRIQQAILFKINKIADHENKLF